MQVLDRYIIKELAKIFFLATFVLFSVLALEKVNFLSHLLLTQHAPVFMIAELMVYISPTFLTLATPLAVLMATLMAFSRFSADNEITAMRAGGISLYRLLTPVFIVSVIAALMTLYLTTSINHKGNLAFRSTVIKILQSNFNLDIKERRFHSSFPGLVIYVNENSEGKLKGVFIADHRQSEKPKIIEAGEGVLLAAIESEFVTMRLLNGVIHSETKTGSYRTIAFNQYNLTMDLTKKLNEPLEKEIPQLSISELRQRIKSLRAKGESTSQESVALHKKFSIPFGCLVLGLMGAPVGIMTHRRRAAGGFGWGVMLIVINYLLLMIGQGLGEGGKIPAIAAMWGPNVIMGVLGLWFMIRATKDTMPILAGLPLPNLFKGSKIKRKSDN